MPCARAVLFRIFSSEIEKCSYPGMSLKHSFIQLGHNRDVGWLAAGVPPSWYRRHRAGSADTCPEAGAGNQELYSELRNRSEIVSDLCLESQESESSRKHSGLVGFLFCFAFCRASPPHLAQCDS